MDWGSLFLGGSGSSPSSYYTPYQNYGQLLNGYTQGSTNAVNQQAPQLNGAQQAQFRQMQMQQAQQLQGVASGQQQGAGELAVQRQVANAQAAQQAQAAMARGGANAGLAMRNAASQQAGIGLSGAGQAQQAALTDQQTAQGQLTNALGQGRTQDLSLAGQNANLTQQQYAQNNQANLGYLQGLSGMDQGQLNAQAAMYGNAQGNKGILGGLLTAGGSVAGAAVLHSDQKLKTNIKSAGRDIDDMLDNLAAKSYRYKDEKHGKGQRAGIMAQDALKSRVGSSLVMQKPDGLAVDVNRALSAALASSARLNERLRKLEQRA